MDLQEEISQLIALRAEGGYWDFKEKWTDKKVDLLHDIICMANNQVGHDAYIIFGVSDSQSKDGVKVKGVPEENRKSQQEVITFLRDKKFAGGNRPSVYLQTLKIPDEKEVLRQIDVLIIKDSVNTLFFLTADFKENKDNADKSRAVRAGYIYTRIEDTNTPIDSVADLDKIEYLWRKRFGIGMPVMERLSRLLDSPDDWAGSLSVNSFKYHKFFPEFQVCLEDIEDKSLYDNSQIIKNLVDQQANPCYRIGTVIIKYHSTELFREEVLYLDGYRYLIPFPQIKTVYKDGVLKSERSITYLYFNKDSIQGKLLNCFSLANNNWYGQKWNRRPGISFLVFQDETERRNFDNFVENAFDLVEKDYNDALKVKDYVHNTSTEEYFARGFSKANEIKAQHLYEMFMGIEGISLLEKLPKFISKEM